MTEMCGRKGCDIPLADESLFGSAININMLYVFPLSTNYRQGLRLIISVAASPVVYAYAVDHSSYQEALLAGKCGARLQALPLASHTPELHFLYVNNLAGPA